MNKINKPRGKTGPRKSAKSEEKKLNRYYNLMKKSTRNHFSQNDYQKDGEYPIPEFTFY